MLQKNANEFTRQRNTAADFRVPAKQDLGPRKKSPEHQLRGHPIKIRLFENHQTIYYTTISAMLGNLFVAAVKEVAMEYRLLACNIAGLGVGDEAYADVTQIWQFKPEPNLQQIKAIKQAIEISFYSRSLYRFT